MGSARRHPPPQAAGAAGGSALPGLGRASSEQPCGSQARGRRARHHGGPAGFGVRGEAGAEGVPLPGQGVLTPQPLLGLLVGRRHPPCSRAPLPGQLWQRQPHSAGTVARGSGTPQAAGRHRGAGRGLRTGCRQRLRAAGEEAASRHRQRRSAGPLPAGAGPGRLPRNAGGNRLHTHIFPPRAHLAQSTSGAWSRRRGRSLADASARHRAGTYRSYSSPCCGQHVGTGTGTRGNSIANGATRGRRGVRATALPGQHRAKPAAPHAPSHCSTCT